jgi:hypothetical protein
MATFALDTSGRTSEEVLALHRACLRFDRPDVVRVRGVWQEHSDPYLLVTRVGGAVEQVPLDAAALEHAAA